MTEKEQRLALANDLSKQGWSDAQALQIASAVPADPEGLGAKGGPRYKSWLSSHGGHVSPYAGYITHELKNSGYSKVGKAIATAESSIRDFARAIGNGNQGH